MNPRPGPRRAMAGISMIEALVGLLLISLWLLSSAGLQVNSMKFQAGAASRFSAIALASELSERMEANARGSKEGEYALPATAAPLASEVDCTAIACTPAQIAAYDLAQWTARVAAELRQLQTMSVVDETPAGGLATYRITIQWAEPKGRQSYEQAQGTSATTTETMSYVTTKVVHDADV